jgi:hypothetical protein
MVEYVEVFPYRCQCGEVYGEAVTSPPTIKCGTNLKNLISWFPVPKKKGCASCIRLEQKMNIWGPEKCREKMPYILARLRIAANRRGLPFSERLVKLLVEKAING